MPNWTSNAIACKKEALRVFVNDDGQVDFNLMRPMPEDLNITSGGCQTEAVKAALGVPEEEFGKLYYPYKSYPDFGASLPFDVENFDDLKRLGKIYLENERKYGSQTWYDWCCENWGTKWNACESCVQEFDDMAIATFRTAWCAPKKKMFDEAFANAGFEYYAESYDEDFYGIYQWNGKNGGLIFRQIHETEYDDEEDEAYGWDTGDYDPCIERVRKILAID